MRWEDEKYVRWYTRDTVDFLALSFEAQGLLGLILRKVDRAGLMQLGRHGKRAVAVLVGHAARWDMIGPALEELLADGCVRIEGDTLILPNFIEAQETPQSDAHRKRESRARARDVASAKHPPADIQSRNVTSGHETSRGVSECPPQVTSGHVESQEVTLNCAVPNCAVPTFPNRGPRIGVGHPAFEAIQHWTGLVWPKLSTAKCPDVTTPQAQRLADLCARHGPAEVMAAMDCAAADEWWASKLDLSAFVGNFGKFLPHSGATPDEIDTLTPEEISAALLDVQVDGDRDPDLEYERRATEARKLALARRKGTECPA